MKLTAAAAISGLITVGLGVAVAPATAADTDVTGTYAFTAGDGESATWTLTPCGANAPGCVRVSEAGNAKRAPWSADARISVGSWILLVEQPDAILCEDGTAAPGVNTYSWDAVGLSGNASIMNKGACGGKTGNVSIPFTLSRIGAAEAAPPGPVSAPAPAGAPAPVSAPAPAGPPLPAESPAAAVAPPVAG
ncbi:hypothetical protein [Mycolicibacterium sp.]|jgi:hypothetical protein|uniref:hypothetical protein n=1 Tax=Mycolicibacterium sp. TaxID=2320850 RepID=UPI0028B1F2AB|nr:hypothetical protein [Mycolicibacterium sp.]